MATQHSASRQQATDQDHRQAPEPAAAGAQRPELPTVGILLGRTVTDDQPVHLPIDSLPRHCLITSRSSIDRLDVMAAVLDHMVHREPAPKTAPVVLESHGELQHRIFPNADTAGPDAARILDLDNAKPPPALNVLHPALIPDRDACVDSIVGALEHRMTVWGPRVKTIVTRALQALHEYNAHPDTAPHEMRTLLDLRFLLYYQTHQSELDRILSRVANTTITNWFQSLQQRPTRGYDEAARPIAAFISQLTLDGTATAVLGRPQCDLDLNEVLHQGHTLLVKSGDNALSDLVGSALVTALATAVRQQENRLLEERLRCLLAVDAPHEYGGVYWGQLMADFRLQGSSVMLSTPSVSALDRPDRQMLDEVLANAGSIFCHQVSAADADRLRPELGAPVEAADLTALDFHHCYARLYLADRALAPVVFHTGHTNSGVRHDAEHAPSQPYRAKSAV